MRRVGGVASSLALAFVCVLASPAMATSDGSPWGYSGTGKTDCTTCHFEQDAIAGSSALSLAGLEGGVAAGETYRLTLTFKPDGMAIAGFQMRADTSDGSPSGTFSAIDDRVDVNGAQVRSRIAGATPSDGASVWSFDWKAPEDLTGDVSFFVAANAGNDDMSPFGDVIHLQVFSAGP